MKTITIFEKYVKVMEQISLEEMLMRIKLCIYGQWIKPLRRMLKDGNRAAYDVAKKTLYAFTPSGKFLGGRKREFLVDYTGIVILDFDYLTQELLREIKAIVNGCEYTLACFVSPSGNGLKVLVSVSTGASDHLKAFLSVQRYYQSLTGVDIDPSGKDITRLCFVSMDEDLYYNPGAVVFDPLAGSGESWPAAKPNEPVGEGTLVLDDKIEKGSGSVAETYRRCIAYVQRRIRFVEGQRNEYVFTLSLKLKNAGVPEGLTEMMLLRDYNFDEREVLSCIKSAYSYSGPDDPPGRNPNGEGALPIKPPASETPPAAKKRQRKPADALSDKAVDSGEPFAPEPIPQKKMQKGG